MSGLRRLANVRTGTIAPRIDFALTAGPQALRYETGPHVKPAEETPVSHRLFAAGLALAGMGLVLSVGCARGPRVAVCPASPCEVGLTDEEIDQMPILDRPDRPGHYLGNSIRRVYRMQTGEPEPLECPDQPVL